MTYSGNIVTWILEYVNPNDSYQAVFSINEKEPAAAGDREENSAEASGITTTLPPPALPITLPIGIIFKVALNGRNGEVFVRNNIHIANG